jgi:hypothetical protein
LHEQSDAGGDAIVLDVELGLDGSRDAAGISIKLETM